MESNLETAVAEPGVCIHTFFHRMSALYSCKNEIIDALHPYLDLRGSKIQNGIDMFLLRPVRSCLDRDPHVPDPCTFIRRLNFFNCAACSPIPPFHAVKIVHRLDTALHGMEWRNGRTCCTV